MKPIMDYTKITNIKFDDVKPNDYPDYCDAFICAADYNEHPMTEEELDLINEDADYIHLKLLGYL